MWSGSDRCMDDHMQPERARFDDNSCFFFARLECPESHVGPTKVGLPGELECCSINLRACEKKHMTGSRARPFLLSTLHYTCFKSGTLERDLA